MKLNPNLSFQNFMKAALYAAETEFLASRHEEDKCAGCRWYHPENATCQMIKASTGGSGYVTEYNRHYCSFAEPPRKNG